MNIATPTAPRAKSTLKIIDTDTHFTEPHDLWLKRAPASLKDRVPQVKMQDGHPTWVIDGDKPLSWRAHPSAAIRKNGDKIRSLTEFMDVQFDDIHTGAWDVQSRLAVMKESGIYAQVVYPNILGFGGQNAAKVDADLRLATVQMFNDAMVELQSDSGERMFPMALLPWWDIKSAVKEVERAGKLGLRGVNINSDPQLHIDAKGDKLPDLGDVYWNPLWEICQDMQMSINFHIGASASTNDFLGAQGWPTLGMDLDGAVSSSMLFFSNARVMANIIFSGILDRYPKLQFVSVESGVTWVPFLLESLEYQLDEYASNSKFELRPTEYFRRNFHATFWFEKWDISHSIRKLGVDNVMFETDFPHPTSLFPVDDIEARLSELTVEEREKVLSLNASKVYRIPV